MPPALAIMATGLGLRHALEVLFVLLLWLALEAGADGSQVPQLLAHVLVLTLPLLPRPARPTVDNASAVLLLLAAACMPRPSPVASAPAEEGEEARAACGSQAEPD